MGLRGRRQLRGRRHGGRFDPFQLYTTHRAPWEIPRTVNVRGGPKHWHPLGEEDEAAPVITGHTSTNRAVPQASFTLLLCPSGYSLRTQHKWTGREDDSVTAIPSSSLQPRREAAAAHGAFPTPLLLLLQCIFPKLLCCSAQAPGEGHPFKHSGCRWWHWEQWGCSRGQGWQQCWECSAQGLGVNVGISRGPGVSLNNWEGLCVTGVAC